MARAFSAWRERVMVRSFLIQMLQRQRYGNGCGLGLVWAEEGMAGELLPNSGLLAGVAPNRARMTAEMPSIPVIAYALGAFLAVLAKAAATESPPT